MAAHNYVLLFVFLFAYDAARGTNMSAAPQILRLGYPDFWPTILEKHQEFLTKTQKLGPMINELFSQPHSEPLHKVCRHLAKMVANSTCAVLVLGVNGFGNDALKIARSMFEAAVTIGYLRKHPEEFDDYFDFHFVVADKRQRYMEKYSPESLGGVTPEAIASSKDGYKRVALRYTDKNGKVRGRWSKKSFAAICAELGLQEHYLTFYDLTSHIIHADISGVMAQADPEPGVLDIDIAPSEAHVEMAFSSAHCALVLAIGEYVAVARPEKQALADQIEKDFVAVWKRTP